MADQLVPVSVANMAKIVNQSIYKKILNLSSKNFEVMEVIKTPHRTDGKDIDVRVRIDMAVNTPNLPIASTDRYATRKVAVTRIPLKDILEFRNFAPNELGQYELAINDVETAGSVLGAKFIDGDIEVNAVGNVFVVRALPDSLGYTGSFTCVGADAPAETTPETPTPAPVKVTSVLLDVAATLETNTTAPIAIEYSPENAEIESFNVTTTFGTITGDRASGYVLNAGGVVGAGTVTVTIDGVSDFAQFDVVAPAQEPESGEPENETPAE